MWYMILLTYCWTQCASIWLIIFAPMFISGMGLSFSVFVSLGFGIRVMLASQNEFGNLHSSVIFWNNFRRIGINYYLKVCQNSPIKPPGPRIWFFITDSTSVLVICLFIFSVSSWFVLGKLYHSKNSSISSSLSILLACGYIQQSLKILCISEFLIITSPFSIMIPSILALFPFFLMSLYKSLSILFILLKNQL